LSNVLRSVTCCSPKPQNPNEIAHKSLLINNHEIQISNLLASLNKINLSELTAQTNHSNRS